MKKKLIALILAVALIAVAAIGMTLAYFTDTEQAANVFTMGNVKIALHEDNGLASDDSDFLIDDKYRNWLEAQLLEPTVKFEKDVWVENTGKNPTYVRIGILLPTELEPMLVLDYDTTFANEWTLSVDKDGNTVDSFNYKIDGVDYKGYSYTYNTALASGAKTNDTLTSLMLKQEVKCEVLSDGSTVYTYQDPTDNKIYNYTDKDGDIPVLVYAEAGQTNVYYTDANGDYVAHTTADGALNAQFGNPGSAGYWADAVFAADADQMIAALEAGEDVVFKGDIDINPASMSNAYGTTGINVKNGQTIDGQGNTLDISEANGTWDSGISTTGGVIKNLTITGSFRGVFVNHTSTHSEPVVLENVTIDGTTYTISCDQGMYQNLIATNSTFKGWTSYAATLGNATFNSCYFGEGNGYAYCRPYAPTAFVGCKFEEGFKIDPCAVITFENCTLGNVALTADNLGELVEAYYGDAANASVK